MAAERDWTAVLTAALGVVYVALGLAAGGWPGGARHRRWRRHARAGGGARPDPALGSTGAARGRGLPFAAATWTSVVTPILAILIVILGGCGLAPSRSSRYRVA